MIKLTVALPMFRSRYIAWAALESLIAQTDVNFDWELIVAEEQHNLEFGASKLESYKQKLSDVHCTNVKYIPLKDWIPLSEKWRLIASNAANTSEAFIIQPADLYSGPHRLRTASDAFSTGVDWIHSANRVFYDLLSSNIYIMDRDLCIKDTGYAHPCGGDMAIKTSLVKKPPPGNKPKGVDLWLFNSCTKANGKPLNIYLDSSDNWKYSIYINGLNNISNTESLWKRKFMILNNGLSTNIPPDILKRLKDSEKHTVGWRRIGRNARPVGPSLK